MVLTIFHEVYPSFFKNFSRKSSLYSLCSGEMSGFYHTVIVEG